MSSWTEVEVLRVYFGDRVNRTDDGVRDEEKRKISRFLVMMSLIKIEKTGKNNFRRQYCVFLFSHQCREVKKEGKYYHYYKTWITAPTSHDYYAYSIRSYM